MNRITLTIWRICWIIFGLGYLVLVLFVANKIITETYEERIYSKQISWQVSLRNAAFDVLRSGGTDDIFLYKYKYFDDAVKNSDINSANDLIIDQGELLLLELDSARYSGYIDKLRKKYGSEIEELHFKEKIESHGVKVVCA